ncbi:hypothetical protein XA68_16974 [Ophiocordyceps unilateralis]|uniref:Protection of telomeres protein 1 n=1 Tax=Ophiocordyceps unilateralis TaxID=268505 RepID=A0A2A9P597_OPHUN|nr:hypothetical protein XA68_16974 [Ophiocordyceps unilateralis]
MLLPSRYVSARDILDGKRDPGSKVNVVGLVTDCRAPIATKGGDWKCEIQLYDQSLEDGTEFLTLNIFRQKDDIPDAHCGDVIAISSAKIQVRSSISLITHHTTVLHVYDATKIPSPPRDALLALRPCIKRAARVPTPEEAKFVSVLYQAINRDRVPSADSFEVMKAQSANVKDKFCELKDVTEGRFVDLVVEIVRAPFHDGDKCTLWVSDYTENELFFKFSFTGDTATGDQVGDPQGYMSKFSSKAPNDGRPFGKRSMQITCFEPHASSMRQEELSSGSWVYLRNIQIKFGRSGSNLEGFLRQDRHDSGTKVSIELLDVSGGSTPISPQLKKALRRKRDYNKEKKEQVRDLAEAAKAGQKRKARPEPCGGQRTGPPRAKLKRKQERNKMFNRTEQEDEPNGLPNLNQQIKCENTNKAASSISQVMERVSHETIIDNKSVKLQLPFINANYRTVVRVINFEPSQLEQFSRPWKVSDLDALSDNEPDSDADSWASGQEDSKMSWEWRFYLELEDATPPDGQVKKTMWVLVDNQAAQCLLNLDATDLSRDPQRLKDLRQQLSILWGDVGDSKVRAQQAKRRERNGPPSHTPEEAQTAPPPPADNLPFSCCLRQYGVKVPEPDRRKANAGEGKRWKRMFGLFGVRIAPA